MNVKELISIVITSFREDIATCQRLSNLLVEQRVYLSAGDQNNLLKVNELIDHASDKLSKSQAERKSALEAFGLMDSREGLMTLVNKLPKTWSGEVLDLYERLEVHIQRCSSLIDRNGELLVDQTAVIQKLLGREPTSYQRTD